MFGILKRELHGLSRIRVLTRTDGATATEYVILITLIAVVIIGVVFAIGGQLSGFFEAAAGAF